ncbi:MAG: Cytochrome c biogenesis protein Ccs1 [Verrucomicrobia subdivision 3 bacterium]|nr:Cytochrome c biogenesis protein Ccs1 [Limisphaerales bacterium]MCS1414501.1 Cytochrome c biogenesis protein Ccs1 [Limisphaerales bacterium]
MVNRLFQFLTSLKLTVGCLAVSMVLVFVGTIAQVDEGLYAAQERYFKSFLIYLEPANGGWLIPIFPGGYAVGLLLLVNLIAAHGKRFKIAKKKFGIFLTHAGLILLLVGQLFTDLLSRESALDFEEGETKNFSIDFRKSELVLIDKSAEETDTIYSVPESRLKKGATISDAKLPFRIEVRDYWVNSNIFGKQTAGAATTIANQGPAKDFFVLPLDPVTEMETRDQPSAVVELFDGDQSIGIWLTSAILKPQTVEHDGKSFDLSLRFKRYYEPFSLTLLKATHDNYKGTELPKNFSSRVRLRNEATNEDREVLIYMNHPLRYGGLTFYQHQMTAGDLARQHGLTPTSTLQVVRNPTWLTPYLACLMVGFGLLIQFMMHLAGFLRKQRSKDAAAPPDTLSSKKQKKSNQSKRSAGQAAKKSCRQKEPMTVQVTRTAEGESA